MLAFRVTNVVLTRSWTPRPWLILWHSGRRWNENTLILKSNSIIIVAILSRSWTLLIKTAIEDVTVSLSATFAKSTSLSFWSDSLNALSVLPRGWSLVLRYRQVILSPPFFTRHWKHHGSGSSWPCKRFGNIMLPGSWQLSPGWLTSWWTSFASKNDSRGLAHSHSVGVLNVVLARSRCSLLSGITEATSGSWLCTSRILRRISKYNSWDSRPYALIFNLVSTWAWSMFS